MHVCVHVCFSVCVRVGLRASHPTSHKRQGGETKVREGSIGVDEEVFPGGGPSGLSVNRLATFFFSSQGTG